MLCKGLVNELTRYVDRDRHILGETLVNELTGPNIFSEEVMLMS